MPAQAILCTLLTALPLAGALGIVISRGSRNKNIPAIIALVSSVLASGIVGYLWFQDVVSWRIPWIESAGTNFGWYLDGLSKLLAIIIAGISILVICYSSVYWRNGAARNEVSGKQTTYYTATLVFIGSMFGIIQSEDIFQLYLFWEMAEIASFILIGLNWQYSPARQAATKAVIIKTLGGLSILLGFVLIRMIEGTSSIPEIIERVTVPGISLSTMIITLLLIGAATVSAQLPFYVWLPNAYREAPTPVSAQLAGIMDAAGIFLILRLALVINESVLSPWLLIGAGAGSMLLGGLLALRQRNLKRLLGYSTISNFGLIFVLVGLGPGGIFAALWTLLHHAFLKAGLFLSTGLISGTGETRKRLAGLPVHTVLALIVAGILALSLGGIPPLGGFWMKELFFESALAGRHPFLLASLGWITSVLALTYMLYFLALFRNRIMRAGNSPELGPLAAVVAIPAVISVAFGIQPNIIGRELIEPAFAAVTGSSADIDIVYHPGPELLLSMFAIAGGIVLFISRDYWLPLLNRLTGKWSLSDAYQRAANSIVRLGQLTLLVQNGSLHRYLYLILAGFLAITTLALPQLSQQPWFIPWQVSPLLADYGGITASRVLLLLFIAAGTVMTYFSRTHLRVILALGIVGYIIGGMFGLLAAPALGLIQVHVETLITVLFIVLLVRIPHQVRQEFEKRSRRKEKFRAKLILAGVIGAGAAFLSWLAISHQPIDPVAAWYNANAHNLVGAEDIVTSILLHFRALDTLGEIMVFAVGILGVLIILRLSRKENR